MPAISKRTQRNALGIVGLASAAVGLACVTVWMCDNLVYYYGYDYKMYGPAVLYGSLTLLFLLTSLVAVPRRKQHRRRDAAD